MHAITTVEVSKSKVATVVCIVTFLLSKTRCGWLRFYKLFLFGQCVGLRNHQASVADTYGLYALASSAVPDVKTGRLIRGKRELHSASIGTYAKAFYKRTTDVATSH